jgi:hypothetical protein
VSVTEGEGRKNVRVLYIAGARHCGSTMLDAVLGNAPEACSLGEVIGFHRYEQATECDCRRPPASCDACRAGVKAITDDPGAREFQRLSRLPFKERTAHWARFGTKARRAYAAAADTLLEAVAAETGSTVLIDSSKNMSRAAALVHDSRLDVRVLHLVRDGRGYIRSRTRRENAPRRLRDLTPLVLAPWLLKNLMVSLLLRPRVPTERFLLCRYEDLVRDPDAELARIGRFAGFDTSGLAAEAVGAGVARGHLFEPVRRVDYRWVKLQPGRLKSQRRRTGQSLWYWACGGFLSALWGYDRRQSYLDEVPAATATPVSVRRNR